jgi:uncharacterized C2H2 Zn-finger protein
MEKFPKIITYSNHPLLIDRDELDKQLLKEANNAGFKTHKEYITHKNKPSGFLHYIDYKYKTNE